MLNLKTPEAPIATDFEGPFSQRGSLGPGFRMNRQEGRCLFER
jgi:hypothetical protein